ncbi:uncharacterized protein SCHCODRAFT_02685035 [Schizophyllum commune H4-8]|uniref:uncharacterized protein n=1 Tax=Schizophyllum commune (strain H4-8 / FGSC 9210) TaxID=578458 RepID=UPI00215FCD5F|nr:uncharacterized protein SCHCODRAFT_02685035 [Schizophyllum commune H4-8]KAI5898904.1 hypothetical protein SCHCODRAFT_02685035 [Schizophyllum commune H4-8]
MRLSLAVAPALFFGFAAAAVTNAEKRDVTDPTNPQNLINCPPGGGADGCHLETTCDRIRINYGYSFNGHYIWYNYNTDDVPDGKHLHEGSWLRKVEVEVRRHGSWKVRGPGNGFLALDEGPLGRRGTLLRDASDRQPRPRHYSTNTTSDTSNHGQAAYHVGGPTRAASKSAGDTPKPGGDAAENTCNASKSAATKLTLASNGWQPRSSSSALDTANYTASNGKAGDHASSSKSAGDPTQDRVDDRKTTKELPLRNDLNLALEGNGRDEALDRASGTRNRTDGPCHLCDRASNGGDLASHGVDLAFADDGVPAGRQRAVAVIEGFYNETPVVHL